MWLGRGLAVLAVGMLGHALLAGCGSSGSSGSSRSTGGDGGSAGSSGAQAGQVGNTAGTTPQGCVPGPPCECEGGLIGPTICDGDVEACDCAACPAPAPESFAADFVACGGEPFGFWGNGESDVSELAWMVEGHRCPLLSPSLSNTKLVLRLDDGGSGEAQLMPRVTEAEMSKACMRDEIFACSSFGCSEGGCSSCSCDNKGEGTITGEIGWIRSDTRLSLGFQGTQNVFDYCVSDGTLTLRAVGGSNATYRFKLGYGHGTPVPCTERTLDDCSPGCRVGQCTGSGATCSEAFFEFECTNRQDCTWDDSVCVGEAEPCGLTDYGSVPGCEFTEGSFSCTGLPEPCSVNTTLEACGAVEGCSWSAGECSGTAQLCMYLPLETCEQSPGCIVMPVP